MEGAVLARRGAVVERRGRWGKVLDRQTDINNQDRDIPNYNLFT